MEVQQSSAKKCTISCRTSMFETRFNNTIQICAGTNEEIGGSALCRAVLILLSIT